MPMMSDRVFKALFIFSIMFLLGLATFSYGVAVGKLKLWPHATIHNSTQVLVSLARHGKIVPPRRRMKKPKNAADIPWNVQSPGQVQDGFYFMAGYDNEINSYAAWLFSPRGEKLHQWTIDVTQYTETGISLDHTTPHGFVPLEDGSVIVGFDRVPVMVRLNACSAPVWIRPGVFHHEMSRADDGSIWVWQGEKHTTDQYQYLQNFDALTGNEIRQIGLVEDVLPILDDQAQIFALRHNSSLKHFRSFPTDEKDIFHPNDVDVLSRELAGAFERFEEGDLLISMRNIHLVAVIDPDDYRVKWYSHGPWLFQHDPDFIPGGNISVYSNNTDRARSEIIRIDPVTMEFENPFHDGELRFYTPWQGKHQYLPNGNVLIMVPHEGRAIEVDGNGDIVLEFNNSAAPDSAYNAHMEHAQWLPPDFFESMPGCPGPGT